MSSTSCVWQLLRRHSEDAGNQWTRHECHLKRRVTGL